MELADPLETDVDHQSLLLPGGLQVQLPQEGESARNSRETTLHRADRRNACRASRTTGPNWLTTPPDHRVEG